VEESAVGSAISFRHFDTHDPEVEELVDERPWDSGPFVHLADEGRTCAPRKSRTLSRKMRSSSARTVNGWTWSRASEDTTNPPARAPERATANAIIGQNVHSASTEEA
jgi:hypothetical protein